MRFSGGSVSIRRVDHSAASTAAPTKKAKTQRQSPMATTTAPSDGATMGTSRKTAMMYESTLAIWSPRYRSRMAPCVKTRMAAAPSTAHQSQ